MTAATHDDDGLYSYGEIESRVRDTTTRCECDNPAAVIKMKRHFVEQWPTWSSSLRWTPCSSLSPVPHALHTCFLLLLIVLSRASRTTATATAVGGSFKYSAPDFCHWVQASPESQEVSVSCSVSNIQVNASWMNAIQADGTVALRIQCADGVRLPSSLSNNSLSHLHDLRELEISYCKLASVPLHAFYGLRQLRNLTVHTHNDDWPSTLALSVSRTALSDLEQLERLDLSQNGMWTCPDRLFCPLVNLQVLNLTQNRFRDVRNLGFASSSDTECRLELTVLDLSRNDIQELPPDAFGPLRHLSDLFLQDNQVATVSERALAGLQSLHVLNLSGNDIVALPANSFSNTSELIELYLSNNSIGVLATGLFAGLQQLLVLDLSQNEVTNAWVNADTFQDLIRLVVLNMNHNRLTRIEASIFHNLYSLQILELAHNQIEVISDNAFASMYNLHTLVLGHNRLTQIDAFTLNGLYVLSLLSVNDNRIDSVHADAFRNCSHLQDLHLNGNSLFAVPDSIRHLQFLKTLDLGENHIDSVANASFRGLQQLHGLRLIDNNVGNLTKGTLDDMPALRILNLARNSIQWVEPGTFDANQNLHAIRLDSNYLSTINGLFANLPNLMWLNVSANQVTWFDYALIPLGLQWLDLHSNLIPSLGNYFAFESQLQLQTMDASLNKIQEISASSIPDGIQLLFLNDNRITTVQPYTFLKKPNLTRVDLFGNRIESMDLNAVRLAPVSDSHDGGDDDTRDIPEFYMGGNPFQCDCKMEWLQRINELSRLRQHPRIMDLESIYCRLLHNREQRSFVPLVEVRTSQFLCSYGVHCFTVCHCCDYDACDCEMTCPHNCTCYHDQIWSSNIVACTRANYTQMPYRIPMDTTEVYLDGNHIRSLSSHSFIGRKNMRVLYLNSSSIRVIHNRTFSGMLALEILHLEDNRLIELRGFEFERLENLRELHLHNNRLAAIGNATFVPLRSLQILRLDGNRLMDFTVWINIVNPLLVSVRLGRNPWSCHCRFMEDFKAWLTLNGNIVSDDDDDIRCHRNGSSLSSIAIVRFNRTTCENVTSGVQTTIVVQPRLNPDYVPVLVATLSLFVLLVIAVLIAFIFRHEIRVKLYSCSGVRCCHGGDSSYSDNGDDGGAKLFDAFVSYSSKDEGFVMQVLAPELECGSDPPYQLCLHYRDFPVGAYVSDTIVEAIDSSSRTILLLSDNFIKSEWCRFEFKSAYHQVLKDRRKRLVVILLGEVAQRDLDPDIRLYLKTNPYLKWGEKLFWDKLKFALPDVRHRNKHRDNSSRSVSIHI